MPIPMDMNPKTKRSNKTGVAGQIRKIKKQVYDKVDEIYGGHNRVPLTKGKVDSERAWQARAGAVEKDIIKDLVHDQKGMSSPNFRPDGSFHESSAERVANMWNNEPGWRVGRGRFEPGGEAEQIHERKKAERAAKKAAEEKKKQEASVKKTAARGRAKLLSKAGGKAKK